MTKKRKRPPGRRVQRDPAALTEAQELFLLEYDRNGFNGTRAYQATHPGTKSINAAAVGAYRLLRNAKVRAVLEAQRAERFLRLKMDGDEALARISLVARADIGDALDERGRFLPYHLWPDPIRLALKSIKPGELGDTVTLHDAVHAAELMAQVAGKIKAGTVVVFDHVAYLASKTPAAE